MCSHHKEVNFGNFFGILGNKSSCNTCLILLPLRGCGVIFEIVSFRLIVSCRGINLEIQTFKSKVAPLNSDKLGVNHLP